MRSQRKGQGTRETHLPQAFPPSWVNRLRYVSYVTTRPTMKALLQPRKHPSLAAILAPSAMMVLSSLNYNIMSPSPLSPHLPSTSAIHYHQPPYSQVTSSHVSTLRSLHSLGIAPWRIYTCNPTNTTAQTYRGRSCTYGLIFCYAELRGGMTYEVIEPTSGGSIFAEYLEAR